MFHSIDHIVPRFGQDGWAKEVFDIRFHLENVRWVKSKTFLVKESGDLTFEQPVEGIGDTQYDTSYKCILFYAFV